MRARALVCRSFSSVSLLAVALLLASCKLNPTYKVGGMVSGVSGAGLVLQNNGGDNLAISSDGPFTFSTALKKGKGYNVTVLTQPSGQTCTVANGTGTVSRNVTDVRVDCTTTVTSYTVGGTVSGLTGTGLVLQNNGGNDLVISGDGPFTFAPAMSNGTNYNVTVLTQPSGQGCTVANGSGNIAGSNVTNVAVACATPPAAPTLSLGFGVKELQFSWSAVSGADYYRLLEDPNGASGYAEAATNITALSHNHAIPVHRRLNASYALEACNAGGCARSAAVGLGANLAQAIGYVKASNTGAGDQFGFAVALSADGNTLAVGANWEDSSVTGVTAGGVNETTAGNAAPNAGAVYVFSRSSGAWVQQAYVKASNAEANDTFGMAVALSGDGNTLAVGAQNEASGLTGVFPGSVNEAFSGNAAPNSGAVYVFTRSAGSWSQQAYIKASNTGVFDMFGSSVALNSDGSTLAVGAAFESSALTGATAGDVSEAIAGNGAPFSGAVYVFTRNGATWSQQAFVKASNPESMDVFGNSVALSSDGDTLAVGAPFEDSDLTGVTPGSVSEATAANGPSSASAGAVYVLTRSGGLWSQQAYVKASNTEGDDRFGTSVSLSSDGNTLAVGAPLEDSSLTGVTAGSVNEASSGNGASSAGAAYVFTRSAGLWSQQAYVKASNTEGSDEFGMAVALSGDGNTLAVGAQLEDSSGTGIGSTPNNSADAAGAVYVYSRSAGSWSQQAFVKAPNTDTVARFGNSVALNSDGNTLAVGAAFEDGSTTGIGSTPDDAALDAGAVYLY
jgi:hypothetical protein